MPEEQTRRAADQTLAVILEKLEQNERDHAYLTEAQEAIVKLLRGNGRIGLATDHELVKQSLNKAWWWIGTISASILGLCLYCIRVGLQ